MSTELLKIAFCPTAVLAGIMLACIYCITKLEEDGSSTNTRNSVNATGFSHSTADRQNSQPTTTTTTATQLQQLDASRLHTTTASPLNDDPPPYSSIHGTTTTSHGDEYICIDVLRPPGLTGTSSHTTTTPAEGPTGTSSHTTTTPTPAEGSPSVLQPSADGLPSYEAAVTSSRASGS